MPLTIIDNVQPTLSHQDELRASWGDLEGAKKRFQDHLLRLARWTDGSDYKYYFSDVEADYIVACLA